MPNTALRLCLVSICTSLTGCVFHIGADDWNDDYGSNYVSAPETRGKAYDIRHENRQRLQQLRIGMSEEEVDAIMGTDSVLINRSLGYVNNPYKTEGSVGANGEPTVVRYYYTTLRIRDDIIGDDELTPVRFESGRLVGWGQAAVTSAGR